MDKLEIVYFPVSLSDFLHTPKDQHKHKPGRHHIATLVPIKHRYCFVIFDEIKFSLMALFCETFFTAAVFWMLSWEYEQMCDALFLSTTQKHKIPQLFILHCTAINIPSVCSSLLEISFFKAKCLACRVVLNLSPIILMHSFLAMNQPDETC